MKRLLTASPAILSVIFFLVPLLSIIALPFRSEFYLYNPSIFVIIQLCLILITTIIIIAVKAKPRTIFTVILLFSTIVNSLYLLLKVTSFFCCICSITSVVISFIIFIISTHSKVSKRCASVICFVSSAALIVFSAFFMLFAQIGSITVIKSLSSPNGKYIAEVIDSDDGALGGDTLVKVRELNKDISLLLGKFSPSPIIIYWGEWGEFRNMEIKWKNNNTLLINEIEYPIDISLS